MGAVTNDRDENTLNIARFVGICVAGLVCWAGIYRGSIWIQDLMFGR